MFMVKCLIKLQNCVMRDVWCKPNSVVPMPFATVEDAHEFADQNIIGKKFENIGNKNSVIAFQVVAFNSKNKMKLVG
jgi:hypothetical protein